MGKRVRTTRRNKRKMGGATHVFVVNQVGDYEPGIWPTGYTMFKDALDAVKEYIDREGYEGDEIEPRIDESKAGSERDGVAVGYIRGGSDAFIYIRKVVY